MQEIDLKETFEDDDDDIYDDKFRKKAESGVGVDEVLEDMEGDPVPGDDAEFDEDDILDVDLEDWVDSSDEDEENDDDLYIDVE